MTICHIKKLLNWISWGKNLCHYGWFVYAWKKKKTITKLKKWLLVCAPVKNSNPSQDSLAFCLSQLSLPHWRPSLDYTFKSWASPHSKGTSQLSCLFLMATVVYSICIYEDEFTTSQQSVPSHIQVHLSDFCNYCLCATCCNTHLSSCCSKLVYAQSSL